MGGDSFMDDFVKEFIQFIQQVIPYFIMSNTHGINPMYLLGIPILVRLVINIGNKIAKHVWYKNKTVVRIVSQSSAYNYNKTYSYLIWFLSNNLDTQMLKQLRSETNFPIRDVNIELETETIYEIDHQFTGRPIEYTFEGHVLTFSPQLEELKCGKDSQDIKIISITANNGEIIRKFIDHCQMSYLNNLKNQKKQFYRFYEWNDDKKQWSGRKIETIKTFDNIFLEATMKQNLKNYLDKFIANKNFYQEMGIPHKKGMIFCGKPGNGKTSTEYAIANHYQRDIYTIRLDELTTGEKLKIAMTAIKDDAIVVFEDIDAHSITHERKPKKSSKKVSTRNFKRNLQREFDDSDNTHESENSSNESEYIPENENSSHESENIHESESENIHESESEYENENECENESRALKSLIKTVSDELDESNNVVTKTGVFQTLLEILDGYNYLNGAIIIMTTNHPEMLDEALIRYGRIDHTFYFDHPTRDNLELILHRFLKLQTSDPIVTKFKQLPMPTELSSAEFINNIIMPNLDDHEKIIQVYRERGLKLLTPTSVNALTPKSNALNAPKATTPKATAPKATAPKATAPKATAPKKKCI